MSETGFETASPLQHSAHNGAPEYDRSLALPGRWALHKLPTIFEPQCCHLKMQIKTISYLKEFL